MRFENTWQEIRDYSFIQNHSRSSDSQLLIFSSLTHVLQGSGQRTGKAMIAARFCAHLPIFVLFLRFVFGLLYGWKIKTWPIIRFLTDSVTCWFLSVGIWYNAWCHVSKHDVQDLQQKYRPTLNLKYSSIFHCTLTHNHIICNIKYITSKKNSNETLI